MKKGKAIRFTRGLYAGKSGWINDDKNATALMVYEIVNLGTPVRSTRVLKGSVGEEQSPLHTYAEAMFQQNPDIEMTLIKLCQQLAKCNIMENNPAGLYGIVNTNLVKVSRRQAELGSKATYRQVEFHPHKKNH
jgi:hypothetical protein